MSDAPPPILPSDGPPPVPEVDAAASLPVAYADPARYGADEVRLAHPAVRAAAFLLDGLGTFIVTTLLVFAGLYASAWDLFVWPILLVPLASAVLSTVLTAVRGVTPAKALLGLRVVDAGTNAPVGWGRATLRSLVIVSPILLGVAVSYVFSLLPYEARAYSPSWPTTFFVIPLFAWIAMLIVLSLAREHRGLQDRAARSVVVRR